MHELLEDQVYRLAYWRVAAEEINYRRFFDVNELAGLRTEDPKIFDLTHALILRWAREGGVTGLRIDHPDGLADPLGYFRRLQERLFLGACRERLDAEGRGDDWEQVVAPLRARYRAAVAEDPIVAAVPAVPDRRREDPQPGRVAAGELADRRHGRLRISQRR